jgi:hypothetical protein
MGGWQPAHAAKSDAAPVPGGGQRGAWAPSNSSGYLERLTVGAQGSRGMRWSGRARLPIKSHQRRQPTASAWHCLTSTCHHAPARQARSRAGQSSQGAMGVAWAAPTEARPRRMVAMTRLVRPRDDCAQHKCNDEEPDQRQGPRLCFAPLVHRARISAAQHADVFASPRTPIASRPKLDRGTPAGAGWWTVHHEPRRTRERRRGPGTGMSDLLGAE